MQTVRLHLFVFLTLCLFCAPTFANKVFYKGSNGVGKGKHLVLVASDHEYRAEETIPALARILSVHGGFDCTVLFGVNDEGEIERVNPISLAWKFYEKRMGWSFLCGFWLSLPSR